MERPSTPTRRRVAYRAGELKGILAATTSRSPVSLQPRIMAARPTVCPSGATECFVLWLTARDMVRQLSGLKSPQILIYDISVCYVSVTHPLPHALSLSFSLWTTPEVAHEQWKFSMRAKNQDESSNFFHLQYISPFPPAARHTCMCMCVCVSVSVSDSRILMKFYSVHIPVNVISAARLVLQLAVFYAMSFCWLFRWRASQAQEKEITEK